MIKKIQEKGSVALITVLTICAVLVLITIGMSNSSFSNSKQYQNYSSDNLLYYGAEACLEETAVRIKKDVDFTGSSIVFDDITCVSAVTGSTTKTISVTVSFLDYSQNYTAEILTSTSGHATNVSLSNWAKN